MKKERTVGNKVLNILLPQHVIREGDMMSAVHNIPGYGWLTTDEWWHGKKASEGGDNLRFGRPIPHLCDLPE